MSKQSVLKRHPQDAGGLLSQRVFVEEHLKERPARAPARSRRKRRPKASAENLDLSRPVELVALEEKTKK